MDVMTKPDKKQRSANTTTMQKRNPLGLIIIVLVILIPLAGTLTSSLATTTTSIYKAANAARHSNHPAKATPAATKPTIFTFDDGREDSYQHAYPILFAHHFSGMFYIVSGKVGWNGQMTWPQLRTMLTHGMQMGAHTIHHVNLASVLLASQEQSQQELQIPPIVMRQQLGIVIQHFCYPYGEPFYLGGRYQRQQVLKMLPANGYIDATVAVGSYFGITQSSTSPFTLPRVPVFGFETLAGFAATLP